MTSDVTPSRGRDVTPSEPRNSRGRMADLRRRRRLDQQIVKIWINASEVEAGATIRSAIETFLSDLLV